jgi:hypothetical protein
MRSASGMVSEPPVGGGRREGRGLVDGKRWDEMEGRGRTACRRETEEKETTQRQRREAEEEVSTRRSRGKKARRKRTFSTYSKEEPSVPSTKANKERERKRIINDPTNSEPSVLDSGEALLNRPPAFSSRYEVLDGAIADS